MARFTILTAFLAIAASASALPFQKRIAQTTIDAVKPWEAACRTAGGGTKCNDIAVAAAGTLLAAPPSCAQQNSADAMITFAKTLKNNAEVIRLAQIFRQQPRNAPDSLASLYCQTAPKNKELKGLFQCQFAGVKQTTFTGNVKAGAAGTVPQGLKSVSPAGSCPANLKGPVRDGAQLNTLVRKPRSLSTSNTFVPALNAAAAKPFKLQNGLDAQKLNKSFTSLSTKSSCKNGQQACIGGGFAQCVGGKFNISQCSAGTKCFALPLVNKAGTSLTCDTQADAEARIAATGAKGGLRG